MFTLHPQLEQDTHCVGELPLCRVCLMDHATNPWLILAPKKPDLTEIYQLEPTDQSQLIKEISLLSHTLEHLCQPDKLNVAALGNMVPQLHIHLIARYHTDPAWPQPIWNQLTITPYEKSALQDRLHMLRETLAHNAEFQRP